jgi:hypothetical protein
MSARRKASDCANWKCNRRREAIDDVISPMSQLFVTDPGEGYSPLTTDQRDDGYSRKVGVAPDIGAFEKQSDNDPDVIFDDSFD